MGRKAKKIITKKLMTEQVVQLFLKNSASGLNYKQISAKLDIKDGGLKQMITTILNELKASGFLEEEYTGKYKYKHKGAYVTGIVDMTSSGSAYIISDEVLEDIFVSRENMMNALHGDRVKVYVFVRKKAKKSEGEIVEIIDRARTTFVGTIEKATGFAFLIPESRNMPYDIFIPGDQLSKARNGDRAIVKIVTWSKGSKNPVGEIVEILGKAGDHQAEMHAILAEFQLPIRFSQDVIQAADNLPDQITPEDIASRRDFREITTFTIDPEDAKDFDDALSFRRLENGNFEIGVHIADVTHYVRENTLLEKEAAERATSVYLVDRVVPMLPERLSNFICSLRPHEDKLCFAAVFEMNEAAQVLDSWFGRTIIHSNHRFTYQEAQTGIDTHEGPLSEELDILNKLAQTMRKNRFRQGAIAFDRVELKFKLDEAGKPLGVFQRLHGTANELIEEFMLLANKMVAEYVGKVEKGRMPKTFVYRIHDKPDQEKLANLSAFIQRFGYTINPGKGESTSHALNRLLDLVDGRPEQNIIETLAVRSMAKAIYSTANIGHYGLAFPYYTHFTSPIRRYPDMMVHRLLAAYLNGEKSKEQEVFEAKSKHSSFMEQQAAQAERASVKYKAVEFMQDKIGKVFDGIISGVTDWGLYVEIIENKIEGMVPIRELDDDFYIFDDKEYCITGQNTDKQYRLGDVVHVQIIRTNLAKKQLDLAIVENVNR